AWRVPPGPAWRVSRRDRNRGRRVRRDSRPRLAASRPHPRGRSTLAGRGRLAPDVSPVQTPRRLQSRSRRRLHGRGALHHEPALVGKNEDLKTTQSTEMSPEQRAIYQLRLDALKSALQGLGGAWQSQYAKMGDTPGASAAAQMGPLTSFAQAYTPPT